MWSVHEKKCGPYPVLHYCRHRNRMGCVGISLQLHKNLVALVAMHLTIVGNGENGHGYKWVSSSRLEKLEQELADVELHGLQETGSLGPNRQEMVPFFKLPIKPAGDKE